jgi:hypothetical protein
MIIQAKQRVQTRRFRMTAKGQTRSSSAATDVSASLAEAAAVAPIA